ncbi:MAG: methyltransferase domain-containing protein [Acidobacteria bacterium]|nr:methyltransferase domain-containing protein [Acidobacteriota bacterium]
MTLMHIVLGVLIWGGLVHPVVPQKGRRDAEDYIKLLETERRVESLQVERVIESLELKPGMRVADLGSGSGLFTRPLAKKVGSAGLIYAVDVDAKLLEHVAKTSGAAGLGNVITVLGEFADPKVPEPVDLITIIDTLHHIERAPDYVKGLRKYLRQNGRVAIIDFSKNWPAGHESMVYQLSDLDKWMGEAGFKRAGKFDFLEGNFFVIYK